jgi:hypothetical protein
VGSNPIAHPIGNPRSGGGFSLRGLGSPHLAVINRSSISWTRKRLTVSGPHWRASRPFGLDDEAIWETVNRVCEETPNELRPEDLEELIAALAERIQRRSDCVNLTSPARPRKKSDA